MKKFILFLFLTSALSCNFSVDTSTDTKEKTKAALSPEIIKESVNQVLENWHKAAAEANFNKYFNLMTEDGVFIGTDASENWQNEEFREYAKPHFDKGKAWSFSTLDRNIYIADNGQTAWFDELLETQMGICRGSGVVIKNDDGWKIEHYVLSMAIPNEYVTEVTELKKSHDETLILRLK